MLLKQLKSRKGKIAKVGEYIGKNLYKSYADQNEREYRFMQMTGEKGMIDDDFVNPNFRGGIQASTPVPVGGYSGMMTVNAININSTVEVKGIREITDEVGRLATEGAAEGLAEALSQTLSPVPK